MPTAVIVDAVRTPVGRRGGVLSGWHAVDLAAQPLAALLTRNDLDPALVEDVVMGCTMTVGEQAMNIARNAALAAGYPISVPGTTVDRQCGSAQQAIHFAAQAVASGAMEIAIGAGIESMSRVPIGSTTEPGPGEAYGPLHKAKYDLIHQGECAEEIARRWGISREDMDRFGYESHQRAARATAEGRFARELLAIDGLTADGVATGPVTADEGIRPDGTYEKMASLRPAFREDGLVTAATSSQISDGAAAVLVMSEARAAKLGYTPRARFHTFAVAANDPQIMLTAPIPATAMVLEKAGLSLDQIDLVEINEAFASVVLAWEREFHPDMAKVNVNGGAIAIGHPTGCSGARLMSTLLCELERTGGRYGLQVMCEGGGQANATIIERLGWAWEPTSKRWRGSSTPRPRLSPGHAAPGAAPTPSRRRMASAPTPTARPRPPSASRSRGVAPCGPTPRRATSRRPPTSLRTPSSPSPSWPSSSPRSSSWCSGRSCRRARRLTSRSAWRSRW
jgi:acetyl-CoA acetyltransferase family protein